MNLITISILLYPFRELGVTAGDRRKCASCDVSAHFLKGLFVIRGSRNSVAGVLGRNLFLLIRVLGRIYICICIYIRRACPLRLPKSSFRSLLCALICLGVIGRGMTNLPLPLTAGLFRFVRFDIDRWVAGAAESTGLWIMGGGWVRLLLTPWALI